MQLQQKICVDVVFRHAYMWLNSATVPLKYILCIHIFNMGHQIHARKSITDYPEHVKLVSPAFNVMTQWCFLCILPSSPFTISPPSSCYMYCIQWNLYPLFLKGPWKVSKCGKTIVAGKLLYGWCTGTIQSEQYLCENNMWERWIKVSL
jgi:hypothetical protein